MKRIPHQIVDGTECKRCATCTTYLPLSRFAPSKHTADGLVFHCNPCKTRKNKQRYLVNAALIKQRSAAHYAVHKDVINARDREKYASDPIVREKAAEYSRKNKDRIRANRKIWRAKNTDKVKASFKEWVQNNREHRREWRRKHCKNKRDTNLAFRLETNLRTRINIAIRNNAKSGSTLRLLGCSILELKTHIESLFQPGMTWSNWGFGHDKWHIDHRRPCASFDLTDPEQQRQCFHWSNLQPLWQKDNLSKGAKYD